MPIIHIVGLIYFFTPIIVISIYFFPFIFPKVLFFSILTQISLVVFLIYFLAKKRNFSLKIKFSVFLFLTFYTGLFISSIFGVDFYYSIWGTVERMEGLIFLINLVFLYFLLSYALENKKNSREILLRYFLFGAFLTFIYTILEITGSPVVVEGKTIFSSSLGNSALYASYLLFVFWFSILGIKLEKNKYFVYFYILILALCIDFIFLAERRATILGVLGSLFLFFIIYSFLTQKKNLKLIIRLGALLIIIGGFAVFAFRDSKFVKQFPGVNRLASISFEDKTTASRILSFKISIDGFKKRPIFGWGSNNFYIVYNKFYDARNLTNDPQFFDKPHNKYIEILVENGIFGFFLYFIFIIYLLKILIKKIDLEKAIILSGFIGYLIQNTFIFDTPSTYVSSVLLFSFISYYDNKYYEKKIKIKQAAPFLYVIFLVIILYIIVLVRIEKQNRFSIKMMKDLYSFKLDSFVKELDLFSKMNPFFKREIFINLSLDHLNILEQKGRKDLLLRIYEAVYKEMKKDFEKKPNNYRFGIKFLQILNKLTELEKQKYKDEFLKYYEIVKDLSPSRPEAYYEIGRFYYIMGDFKTAEQNYKYAISLNPKYPKSLWLYGVFLYMTNNYKKSSEYIEKALEFGYNYRNPLKLKLIIDIFEKAGKNDFVEFYKKKAKEFFPKIYDEIINRVPKS